MVSKTNIWEIAFYSGLIILTIWLILKVTGIINTPVWLEYGVPVSALIISALGLYQNLVNSINKLVTDIAMINANLSSLNAKFDHLDQDMHLVKQKINLA